MQSPTKTGRCRGFGGHPILNAMQMFDDFDAWAETISGASLRLACDAVETPAWALGALQLGDVVLQVASEGGDTLPKS